MIQNNLGQTSGWKAGKMEGGNQSSPLPIFQSSLFASVRILIRWVLFSL